MRTLKNFSTFTRKLTLAIAVFSFAAFLAVAIIGVAFCSKTKILKIQLQKGEEQSLLINYENKKESIELAKTIEKIAANNNWKRSKNELKSNHGILIKANSEKLVMGCSFKGSVKTFSTKTRGSNREAKIIECLAMVEKELEK